MKNNYIKRRLISHKKLAQERTILASERNTLAYIRTGFGSFVLGIALIPLASAMVGGMIKASHVFILYNLLNYFKVFLISLL